MIAELPDLANLGRFDTCIVGAGPAGVTCALRLAEAGRRVLLLEGGDIDFTPESQDLYIGETIGDPYYALDVARLRYFGGSTNHWNGLCRNLDARDFEAKSGFPDTAWPISKAALDPYLPAAADILETGPIAPDEPLATGGAFERIDMVNSPPVRVYDKYYDVLEGSANVTVILNANLTGFELADQAVMALEVTGYDGTTARALADRYVIAAGGIENNRLLLWGNELTGGALVKRPATLSRYWMEHTHASFGEALAPRRFADRPDPSGPNRPTFFAATSNTLTELTSLSTRVALQFTNYDETERLVADLACVAPDLGRWAIGMLGRNLICGASLWTVWEQEPRAVNRVALGSERDAMGMPLTELHWSLSNADIRTAQVGAQRFASFVAENNFGRVRLSPWIDAPETRAPDTIQGGYHHMGGTRMAAGPERGIVDANCKVFGQDNLYIAGSSVFPSAGHANPTFTIVQLSARLADHLLADG